jgi:succinate dehydrogenase / fumarate reductase flavoprotein subunit
MLTVAEAITRAALERRESRGGHFREDFPGKDEAFGRVNISIQRRPDGSMEVMQKQLGAIRDDLQQLITEMK